MRDYTYLGGSRFSINNIFRSLRFDVDRLDPVSYTHLTLPTKA